MNAHDLVVQWVAAVTAQDEAIDVTPEQVDDLAARVRCAEAMMLDYAPAAGARFEVYEADGSRWQLIDGNNEPIANSEPYSSESAARAGAENVRETAPVAAIVDR